MPPPLNLQLVLMLGAGARVGEMLLDAGAHVREMEQRLAMATPCREQRIGR